MTTKSKKSLVVATVLAAGVAGCDNFGQRETKHADVAGVKQALATVEAGWNQAFHTKNIDGLVAPYSNEAVLVLPGLPAQVGTAAIRKTYAEAFKDPNFDVTLASDRVEVAGSGDLAFTQGHLTLNATDPKTKKPMSETGSYVTVFEKRRMAAGRQFRIGLQQIRRARQPSSKPRRLSRARNSQTFGVIADIRRCQIASDW